MDKIAGSNLSIKSTLVTDIFEKTRCIILINDTPCNMLELNQIILPVQNSNRLASQ